jgi:hypothetical protein
VEFLGGGPGGANSDAIAFNETVTNTGTLPVYGLIIQPLRANHNAGFALPGTNCGVGDTSSASKFNSSQVTPRLPLTGEVCRFKGGLKPGETTVVGYLTDFTSSSKASACAKAGAKSSP